MYKMQERAKRGLVLLVPEMPRRRKVYRGERAMKMCWFCRRKTLFCLNDSLCVCKLHAEILNKMLRKEYKLFFQIPK